ncbi:MAG TPA: response regulator [Candidatus Omnitrophota bacterium]|nr:response regulator [Candidatus Omnitrophota bacterium]HQL40767.1 response regulator [Candidatus Omnitrophota bacterium]
MKKILVVDDEPDVLKVLAKELTVAGYHVTTAVNAREALQKVKDILPDLILMDLILPDIGGAEAVKVLKGYPQLRLTPVIFLTAMIKPEEEIGSPLKINIDDCWYETIAKPYDRNDLLLKVQNILK